MLSLLFLFSVFTNSYKLLNGVISQYPKIMSTCENIHPNLQNTFQHVANDITNNGYPIILQNEKNTGIICNQQEGHYGYMLVDEKNKTNIYINNNLLYKPNTLYNVVLHETLHALGLDHNNGEPGMMSYAITQNILGYPLDDNRRLWLSVDDLRGLFEIKFYKKYG